MILQVFTVFDRRAEAYLPPFMMQSRGIALRSFEEACFDPQHAFNKHRDDFVLMFLGTFDDSNASFDLKLVPEVIVTSAELISSRQV